MKRLIILVCIALICVVAVGCTGSQSSGELPAQEAALQPKAINAPVEPVQTISLLIGAESEQVFLDGAALFAQKVAQLSNGALRIQVVSVEDPGTQFAEENACFALLESSANASFSRFFSVVSQPFLYNSYLHFTSSLNSARVLKYVGEDMLLTKNALPLAAFYTGSPQFISAWRTSNLALIKDSPILLNPDNGGVAAFQALGAIVDEIEDDSLRLQLLTQLEIEGAEFSLDTLEGADLKGEKFFLTMTYHKIDPLWLVVNGDYYKELSEKERAILQESCAFLFSAIDGKVLEREQAVQNALSDQNITILTDFSAARRVIAQKAEENKGLLPNIEEQYLRNMIAEMAEYAH